MATKRERVLEAGLLEAIADLVLIRLMVRDPLMQAYVKAAIDVASQYFVDEGTGT